MRSIVVGEVEVVALTDVEGPFFRLAQIFPGVRDEEWGPYFARYPWAFADERTIRGRIGAYLLKTPDRNILVDTGIGPMAFGMPGRLLGELENSGVQPEDVDVVFLTHLHGDHLGWSVTGEGEPTFPHARYVTQAIEWEESASHVGQALAPLERLGVVDLLYGEEPVSEEVIAIPTPGHSTGHASLLVSSGGEGAIVAGDVVVHPAQVAEPLWNIHFDEDKEQATFTREMLLDWIEADGIVIAAGHVPGTGFGRVVREGGRRYWQALGEGDAPASRTGEEETHGSRKE
ncbi:MAG: hypothetical protein AVDCRST_MAG14-1431 [uncultured Rubrobacteraceae bacterium]|uniref:Metallo-beta-lactamase domain-containing protein n=1 Tax=uncultured Rubrobacteraceae bacterium TaxID=349277 RepID=A0A6J4R1V7_9ACTN|nr:MAG: hypothetical protein AVDCRST_MAG14-1431 [uncultured Rubrobacteraceae bacterium]